MSRRRTPSPIDLDAQSLFREAVKDVQRLDDTHVYHETPVPPAIPRQRIQDEHAALDETLCGPVPAELYLEGGDELAFLRTGIGPSVLKDLRRGRWVIQDQLDLHGATRDEAVDLLANFIAASLKRSYRCVRIIHGKGFGSPGRIPILKLLVARWLAYRQEVLAYAQARVQDGGSGAVVVLLRPPPKEL